MQNKIPKYPSTLFCTKILFNIIFFCILGIWLFAKNYMIVFDRRSSGFENRTTISGFDRRSSGFENRTTISRFFIISCLNLTCLMFTTSSNGQISSRFCKSKSSSFNYCANEWDGPEQIRSNLAHGIAQDLSCRGHPYDFVGKIPRDSDVKLENGIVWNLVVSRPRLAFSNILKENFDRISKIIVTAESAGVLRDSADVVRSATGTCFACEFAMNF